MKAALRAVFITAPNIDVAKTIARALVEERLAACVNLMSGVTSVYRWEGAIEESAEVLLIAKTVQERVHALTQRTKELHPYKLPEIIALPVDAALPAYADWIVEETGFIVV